MTLLLMLAFSDPSPWQLGLCRGHGAQTVCQSLGTPQPLEICTAMRDAMRRDGVERVVCAKVLVDVDG